jgi:hypothetical protein
LIEISEITNELLKTLVTHTHSTHTVPPECHEVDYVVSDLMSQKNSRATKNMRYTISR